MRILYVASEAVPFAKTGGLADVMGVLPKAIKDLGHEVAAVIPRYRGINVAKPILSSLTIPLRDSWRFCSVYEAQKHTDIRFFLVDYPAYFDREQLYQSDGVDYPDNSERFALLCLAALELAKRSPRPPDVIHCNARQCALLPVYLKTR